MIFSVQTLKRERSLLATLYIISLRYSIHILSFHLRILAMISKTFKNVFFLPALDKTGETSYNFI